MKAWLPRRTTENGCAGASAASCLRGTTSLATFSTPTAQRRTRSVSVRIPRRSGFAETASRSVRCRAGSTAGPVGAAGAAGAGDGAAALSGAGGGALPRNHQSPPAAPATMASTVTTSGAALGGRIEVRGLSSGSIAPRFRFTPGTAGADDAFCPHSRPPETTRPAALATGLDCLGLLEGARGLLGLLGGGRCGCRSGGLRVLALLVLLLGLVALLLLLLGLLLLLLLLGLLGLGRGRGRRLVVGERRLGEEGHGNEGAQDLLHRVHLSGGLA